MEIFFPHMMVPPELELDPELDAGERLPRLDFTGAQPLPNMRRASHGSPTSTGKAAAQDHQISRRYRYPSSYISVGDRSPNNRGSYHIHAAYSSSCPYPNLFFILQNCSLFLQFAGPGLFLVVSHTPVVTHRL
jgi:hypothetical protein